MFASTPLFRTLFLLLFFSLSFQSWAQQAGYRLLVFEGSDWCANCRRLNKKVLSTSVIQDFLDKKSITLQKVDFPQRKKLADSILQQNKALAERYGFRGEFPTVMLVHSTSDVSKRIPYRNESPEEFIDLLNAIIQKNP